MSGGGGNMQNPNQVQQAPNRGNNQFMQAYQQQLAGIRPQQAYAMMGGRGQMPQQMQNPYGPPTQQQLQNRMELAQKSYASPTQEQLQNRMELAQKSYASPTQQQLQSQAELMRQMQLNQSAQQQYNQFVPGQTRFLGDMQNVPAQYQAYEQMMRANNAPRQQMPQLGAAGMGQLQQMSPQQIQQFMNQQKMQAALNPSGPQNSLVSPMQASNLGGIAGLMQGI
jgi:hypothetical protein